MVKIPPGMREGVLTDILAIDQIDVHLVKGGRSIAKIPATEMQLGLAATQLLLAAGVSAAQRVTASPPRITEHFNGHLILPSEVGIASNPESDHVTLTIGIGAAVLGFTFPNATLHEIGTALLAASVEVKSRAN